LALHHKNVDSSTLDIKSMLVSAIIKWYKKEIIEETV